MIGSEWGEGTSVSRQSPVIKAKKRMWRQIICCCVCVLAHTGNPCVVVDFFQSWVWWSVVCASIIFYSNKRRWYDTILWCHFLTQDGQEPIKTSGAAKPSNLSSQNSSSRSRSSITSSHSSSLSDLMPLTSDSDISSEQLNSNFATKQQTTLNLSQVESRIKKEPHFINKSLIIHFAYHSSWLSSFD